MRQTGYSIFHNVIVNGMIPDKIVFPGEVNNAANAHSNAFKYLPRGR